MKKDYLKMLVQLLHTRHFWILYPFMQKRIKQEDNEVLFLSDSREEFSGNFAFVKEEIEKRKKFHITGIFKKNFKSKKGKSLNQSLEIIKAMCKAKYIFVDDFYPYIYTIKFKGDKQVIQLWHAMGAYKTVGYARLGKPGGPKAYNYTHRNYTGCIVSGEGIVKDYAKAFGITEDKVHALGIPRTDIFFDKKYKEKTIKEIYDKYPVLKNKKVILFAPTFRGNGKNTAYYDYNWIDFKRIKDEFKNNYVCIIKMHPFIKNKPEYDY
ncbi:MAG: CDP-glycerol glycerophosphotransferase family protein [Bacilli bacterium]|nr:CDP-glycerol glycerophosphotransferase family protein [Bacilli bacterium]